MLSLVEASTCIIYFLATTPLAIIELFFCLQWRLWRIYITPTQLQAAMARVQAATNFEEWLAAAWRSDDLQAKTWWRNKEDSYLYDFELIKDRSRIILESMEQSQAQRLLTILQTGMDRKKADILNERLYRGALSGTKTIIEDYITNMCTAIRALVTWPTPRDMSSGLTSQQKLQFFYHSHLAYGRSCLVLQGGSVFGLCHLGVVKELLKHNLLPRIISGSTTGALMAAVVGTNTDDELEDVLRGDRFDLHHFVASAQSMARWDEQLTGHPPPWWQRMIELIWRRLNRYRTSGFVLDPVVLGEAVKANLGDMTFKEAFDKTKRVLNITIDSAGPGTPTALNYRSTPNALIWSAAMVANIHEYTEGYRQTLMIKQFDGSIQEYWPHSRQEERKRMKIYLDETPLQNLCQQFGVNHFVVSRARPSFGFSIPSPINLDKHPIIEGLGRVFMLETKRRFRQIARLLPGRLGNNRLVRPEKIPRFHITIKPEISWRDWWRLLKNPTAEDVKHWIRVGERSVWPMLKQLRPRLAIELELDRGYELLRRRDEANLRKGRFVLEEQEVVGGDSEKAMAKRRKRANSDGHVR